MGLGGSGAGFYGNGLTTDITFPYAYGNGNQYLYGTQQESGGFGGGQAPLPYGFEMAPVQTTAADMYMLYVNNDPTASISAGSSISINNSIGATVTSLTYDTILAKLNTPLSTNAISTGSTITSMAPPATYNEATTDYDVAVFVVSGPNPLATPHHLQLIFLLM
jgi:hypothetical protein